MELSSLNTGEVFQIQKEVSPFRTITDLKDYHDAETYEEGTSMTDLSGFEPLTSIVARCMRVSRMPGGQVVSALDTDLLKQEYVSTGIYEASNANTVDEAFATEDITDSPTFDLADASMIKDTISQTLPTAASKEQITKNQATSEPVVDNSATVSQDMPEKDKA